MDAVTVPNVTRRNYARDEFLPETREQDVKLVQDVLAAVAQNRPDQPRTIILRQEVGSGKTWFVYYLKREILAKIPNVRTLLVSLSPTPPREENKTDEYLVLPEIYAPEADAETLAKHLLEWVAKQLDPNGAPQADLAEQTTWLRNKVAQEFKQETLVLIFDSLFELDWNKLPRLERALLAPLAAIPRVVLILTGRGRIYSWESPLLRVNVARFPTAPLRPFDEKEIQAQLDKQCREHPPKLSVQTILELGGGYPWVNYLLAQGATKQAATQIAAEKLTEVIRDPEARARVRRDLEALSVLEGFSENEMRVMFAAYAKTAEPSKPEVRQRRDEILNTFLMHWRDGRFVIDEPMRRILENYLKYNEPKKWQLLHCRAKQLYQDWAKQFPDHTEAFTKRAKHHNEQLASAEREGMKITACQIDRVTQVVHTAHSETTALGRSVIAIGRQDSIGVIAE